MAVENAFLCSLSGDIWGRVEYWSRTGWDCYVDYCGRFIGFLGSVMNFVSQSKSQKYREGFNVFILQTHLWISHQVRQPAEFKHIIKRRKRN